MRPCAAGLTKFGRACARRLRAIKPAKGDKWHLEEIKINGRLHWLWRAVDQRGVVLDVLVQARRDARAYLSRPLGDRGELPAKVVRVLDAGVHSLPARGRMDVRRVAGEEHGTFAVAVHEANVGAP